MAPLSRPNHRHAIFPATSDCSPVAQLVEQVAVKHLVGLFLGVYRHLLGRSLHDSPDLSRLTITNPHESPHTQLALVQCTQKWTLILGQLVHSHFLVTVLSEHQQRPSDSSRILGTQRSVVR